MLNSSYRVNNLLGALTLIGSQRETSWWRIWIEQPGEQEGDDDVEVSLFKGSYIQTYVQFEYFVRTGDRLLYRGTSLEKALAVFIEHIAMPHVIWYEVEFNYRMPEETMAALYRKGQPEGDGW